MLLMIDNWHMVSPVFADFHSFAAKPCGVQILLSSPFAVIL